MILLNRLKRKKQIGTLMCPKCLTMLKMDAESDIKVCPTKYSGDTPCNYEFPIRYIQNSNYVQPFFIQMFGWTEHGKTVFIDVLRLILLDMRKLWPQYTHQAITQLDMEHERVLRAQLRQGQMPESTQVRDRQQNEVYIMQLDNMVRWGSRSLVIMDHAGEMFADFEVPVDEMPFLIKSPTTFLIISIPKLKQTQKGEAMDQLLNIYIQAMTQHKVNFRKTRRKLVVVLTMADIIPSLPINLKNYLTTDTVWEKIRSPKSSHMALLEMGAYVERMQWVSDEIKDWLQADADGAPGGANLVGLIESNNIEARYSLISATGFDIETLNMSNVNTIDDSEHKKGIQLNPRRVLDPFFWALEFQSE
ncbi:MAG: hypothetical protein AAF702_21465 [Chloroflexota bacterium]